MNIMKNLEVKKASRGDVEYVISLLKEVAQWLKSNEIKQWSYLLEGGEDEEIKKSIQQNDTYLVLQEGELIATFSLSSEQNEWDHHIFGKDTSSDSLYLHRLAVRPAYMNRGIGKRILRWVEENSQSKKQFLKLDCVADNPRLNQFYRESGFEYLGETDNHCKYQKALSVEAG
ncbi:N-acetyltransferase [Fictibacillus barbaricus]|nr:N-acetyltransferase [Fictibacillus barbaricus]